MRTPTIASQVATRRDRSRQPASPPPRQVFVTILGSVELKLPTLAEEYVELRNFLHLGRVTVAEWERCAMDSNRSDVELVPTTILAEFQEGEPPTDDEEIDALAMQCHLGHIPQATADILKNGIGLRGAERRAALRRAVDTETLAQSMVG